MANIGKISPLKREYNTFNGQLKTMSSSLAELGYTMIPGAARTLPPFKERNGSYRTGLDENALYIQSLPASEAEQERQRVKSMREHLEEVTGLDLSPRSEYYTKMHSYDSAPPGSRAEYVKLYDQDNIFNLDDPQQAITFAWLRVHPEIAPSYEAWEKGRSNSRCPRISECKFFVNDTAYEAEVSYNKKIMINKAISTLDSMSTTRRYKVARLLNIPIPNSDERVVYNALDDYLRGEGKGKEDSYSKLKLFHEVVNMADENLEIRFKIKEALEYNIYRKTKGRIYEASEKIADSEEELILYLSDIKNQDEYLSLLKKIESAKIVEI